MTRTLILSNLLVFAIIQLFAGVIFYFFIRDGFIAHFDFSLESKLDTAIHLPEFEEVLKHGVDIDTSSHAAGSFTEILDLDRKQISEDWYYLQIAGADGAVLYKSPTLTRKLDLKSILDDPEDDFGCQYEFVQLPNGSVGRAIQLQLDFVQHFNGTRNLQSSESNTEFGASSGTVVIARDATELYDNLKLLRLALVFFGLLTLALVSLLTFLVTKRGVRPLPALAAEIEGLDESDTTARVKTEVPVELDSIKNRLNEYLQKIELAFERERQFSDDVAHELRTPLAGIMIKLDHALGSNRSDDERRKALLESREIADQLNSIVSKLLEISRLDTRSRPLSFESIDVGETLKLIWDSLPNLGKGNFELEWQVETEQFLNTDLTLFVHLISNIFENARTYVDPGGSVVIRSHRTHFGVEIDVSNSGCNIKEDEVPLVFSRLWRANKSRNDSTDHAGLGLSIASKITRVLNGEIAASVHNSWFHIQVKIPDSRD